MRDLIETITSEICDKVQHYILVDELLTPKEGVIYEK